MVTRRMISAVLGAVASIAALICVLSVGSGVAFASTTYTVLAKPSLNERSAPSTGAGVIGSLPYGTSITISCQTTGSAVNGSDIWDQLPGGSYVADYWVSTPVFNGFSPGLAQCGQVTPRRAVGVTTNHDQGYPGQCTDWADQEFHAYSGLWPDFTGPNNGNAEYWASNAQAKGWTVTSAPAVDSIAVFQPGENGAGSVGHVAWVTSVSGSQITISEMNFYYGSGRTDTRTLAPASGVRYILAP